MGDTVYYNADGVAIPYDSLSPEFRKYIEESRQYTEQDFTPSQKPSDTGYTPFVVVMTSFVVLGYFAVRTAWKSKGTEILGSWHGKREATRGFLPVERYTDADERFRDLTKDYFVYHGIEIEINKAQFDSILTKRLPYYRKLSPYLKEKFINRTRAFLRSKTFLLKTQEPFVDMPVLISGTAVQLTFGLSNYLLPHYQYIRIFTEEYFANGTLKVLAGHVYGNTITLSWNHFLEGHENYTDGVNLGLHEMAHALYFQFAHADASKRFIVHYNDIMAEGAEVYQRRLSSPSELYRENAYRNLQEFWAESVELFFERPAELKRENAELFEALAGMLKQDPLNSLYPILVN